jgi:hypothetical protein
MRLLGFIIALFSSLAAASQPTQIEAQYIVTTNGGITIGRASETFSRTGNVYTIRSETRSDGALKAFLDDQYTVQSTGRVGADGLIPLEYTERRARDNKRDLKSTFDWKMSVMHTELRGEPSDYWFPPGTQDRISIMYQFVYMKELGPPSRSPWPTAARCACTHTSSSRKEGSRLRPGSSRRATIAASSRTRTTREWMCGSRRTSTTSPFA